MASSGGKYKVAATNTLREMAASQTGRAGSVGLTVDWMCGGPSGMMQRCFSML